MSKLRNLKNKNKRIIIIGLILFTFIIMLGTAYALFTDVITKEITATSGTLDIEEVTGNELNIVRKNNINFPIDDPIAPGDEYGFTGSIENKGNLDAKVRVTIEMEDTSLGIWTVTPPTSNETVLAANSTLDISTFSPILLYDLTNTNEYQNKLYTFNIKIEALQDRNTSGTPGEWSEVVTEPFTLP